MRDQSTHPPMMKQIAMSVPDVPLVDVGPHSVRSGRSETMRLRQRRYHHQSSCRSYVVSGSCVGALVSVSPPSEEGKWAMRHPAFADGNR